MSSKQELDINKTSFMMFFIQENDLINLIQVLSFVFFVFLLITPHAHSHAQARGYVI